MIRYLEAGDGIAPQTTVALRFTAAGLGLSERAVVKLINAGGIMDE
jgi:hypothetical protein